MSLRIVTLAAVAASALGAAVSIDRGLPADFAGILDGDPANVAGEFLLWRELRGEYQGRAVLA